MEREGYAVNISVEELFSSERIGKKAGTIGIKGAGKYHRFIVEDGRLKGRLGASKTDDLTNLADDEVLEDLFNLYDDYVGRSTSSDVRVKDKKVKKSKESQRPDMREVYNHEDPEINDSQDRHWIDRELEGGEPVNGLEATEQRLRQIHEEMGIQYDRTKFFPEEAIEELEVQKAS